LPLPGNSQETLHIRLALLSTTSTSSRSVPQVFGGNHRQDAKIHDIAPLIITVPHRRGQLFLGNDVGQDEI